MGKLRGGLCSFHLLGSHMLYTTLPALFEQPIKACALEKAATLLLLRPGPLRALMRSHSLWVLC